MIVHRSPSESPKDGFWGPPYSTPTPMAQRSGASSGHFSSPEHPYLSVSTRKFIADSLGPITMPAGKEAQRRGGEDSLGEDTRGGGGAQ
jgi:hypothetical protein